jgi:hypothetical protein
MGITTLKTTVPLVDIVAPFVWLTPLVPQTAHLWNALIATAILEMPPVITTI